MTEALSEYTNPELAAKAQLDMMNFKAIMVPRQLKLHPM